MLLKALQEQISAYRATSQVTQVNKRLPLFFEISDLKERRKTLARFTKANIKVPKLLDPRQLSDLIGFITDRTLAEISVQFTDFNRLQHIVNNHKTVEGEKEIASLALSSLKLKSEFLCFVFSMERKFGAITV